PAPYEKGSEKPGASLD
nr:class I cytochrome c isoform A {N-terminal} [Candida parapsilosis, CBS 7154, Peptide Partial, 16 aa] [Candida parapsilosis]